MFILLVLKINKQKLVDFKMTIYEKLKNKQIFYRKKARSKAVIKCTNEINPNKLYFRLHIVFFNENTYFICFFSLNIVLMQQRQTSKKPDV